MQTFSDHAHKAFFSWTELLGAGFVKQYEAESIGRAVAGVHTDGKNYFRENSAGLLLPEDKSAFCLHLKVGRNISAKQDKNGVSDIERCLAFINEHQRVIGAGPFVMRKSGLVEIHGDLYINTLRSKCVKPADGVAIYGPDGQFPWLSAYFEALLDPYDPQFFYLISWLAIFYAAVLNCEPQQGHGLILAGGVGVGKTFLNTGVIGGLVGGHADASKFLAGEENFNSAMLREPFLSSDDSVSSSSRQAHRVFTETVKQFVANFRHTFKEKFVKECTIEWFGRVAVSCNDDEQSIRKIPDLEGSILDKLLILRCAKVGKIKFPPFPELKAILARELPWFARWLLQWEIPEELIGESRFIIKPYCEPSLFKAAQQSSITAAFAEILDDFLHEYFGVHNMKEKHWEGTSFKLHKAIMSDLGAAPAMRNYSVDAVGRHLSMLKNKGARIEVTDSEGSSRRWRLFPDTFTQKRSRGR